MTTALEEKMARLERKLKSRSSPDGKPRKGYEQSNAAIRAEMELISSRIEFAQSLEEGNDDGE